MTLSFSGMLNGPIKEALTKTINQLFDELIKDNHVDVKLCHNRSRIEPSADYVNFSNIQILRKLDAYLNSTGAIKKLNNFLECTTSVLTSRLNTVQPKISFEGNSLQLRNLEMENNGMVQKLGKSHKQRMKIAKNRLLISQFYACNRDFVTTHGLSSIQ